MSNDLIETMTQHTPTDLGRAMLDEISAGTLDEVALPVDHYQAAGLYGRRIYVPAGTVVVTALHKAQHITIALVGRCTVVDAEGNKAEVTAPAVWVTEPGTQRSVYCHTDVEWVTVHHTDLTEVDEIEDALVVDTLADYRLQIEAREGGRLV